MGFPVILTPQSQDDLAHIVRYIAEDSPEEARAFGHLLIDKALSIGFLPERGRVTPELNDASVRELVHGSYRIIYEVFHDPTVIYVLRFWHSARGTPEINRPPP
jgi:plasmid stabilization system protein ParE